MTRREKVEAIRLARRFRVLAERIKKGQPVVGDAAELLAAARLLEKGAGVVE